MPHSPNADELLHAFHTELLSLSDAEVAELAELARKHENLERYDYAIAARVEMRRRGIVPQPLCITRP